MTAGCLHRSPAITEKSPLPMRSTSRLMSVLFLASDEAVGTVPPQRGPRPLTANTQDTRSTSQPSNQNLMCRAFHMQHQQHYIIVAIIVAIIVRCSLLERDQRKLALLIISCLVQPGNPSHPWPVVFCPPPSPKGRAVVVRRATDGNLPSAARSLMNRLLAGCLTSSGGSMTDSDFWQELTAATGDSVQISHPRRLSADLATSSPVNYQGGGCPDCSPRRIPSTSPLLVSLILKRKHYPRACPWLRCSSPPTTALAGNLGTQADQQADERRACRPCVPTYHCHLLKSFPRTPGHERTDSTVAMAAPAPDPSLTRVACAVAQVLSMTEQCRHEADGHDNAASKRVDAVARACQSYFFWDEDAGHDLTEADETLFEERKETRFLVK
ncbi:hypothetical protein BKA81DRAFT_382333 [Phyllosticta paracitricarpa]|uniref:Uncharacterized protein n=1 Tax=Phyllosticta citricarpa TaxID=55181 RepID=A0ABR1MSD4_9PEZI